MTFQILGFAFEAGLPIYQTLDGPQLQSDWRIVLGWPASRPVRCGEAISASCAVSDVSTWGEPS